MSTRIARIVQHLIPLLLERARLQQDIARRQARCQAIDTGIIQELSTLDMAVGQSVEIGDLVFRAENPTGHTTWLVVEQGGERISGEALIEALLQLKNSAIQGES